MLSLDGRTAERPALAGRPRLSPRSAHGLAERALGPFGRVTGLACRARETNGARDLCDNESKPAGPSAAVEGPKVARLSESAGNADRAPAAAPGGSGLAGGPLRPPRYVRDRARA